jgi:hypothetical protein
LQNIRYIKTKLNVRLILSNVITYLTIDVERRWYKLRRLTQTENVKQDGRGVFHNQTHSIELIL